MSLDTFPNALSDLADGLGALEPAPGDFTPPLPSDPPTGEIAPLAGAEGSPEASEPPPRRVGAPRRYPDTPERMRERERDRRRRARQKAQRLGLPMPEDGPTSPSLPAGPTPEDMAAVGAALALGFQTIAKLVAGRRGKHWELTAGEAGQLGAAWAEAARPWLGKVGPAVPWVTAALVTAGVVAPRLIADGEATPDNPPAPVPEASPAPAPAPPARAGDSPVAIQPPRVLPPSGDGTIPIAEPPGPDNAGGGPIRPPRVRK